MMPRQIQITLFAFASLWLMLYPLNAQDTEDEAHIEVSLRLIGHEVLLSSGDSISRILPITKEDNRYRIQLESEFQFEPETLVQTVNRVVEETGLAKSYIVEVEACESGEVVYSYEMNQLEQKDIIPCGTRVQPKSCYSLLFTVIETEKASQMHIVVIIILLALLIVVFFFLRNRKSKSTTDPNLIPLGEYIFDKRNTELLFENQRIDLTSKEADLLLLLYNAANTSIEREIILNMVWGDEGDYVGRTLDVFISKLRKKLEADSNVKIVNIRGVGYKLILNDPK